MSEFSFNPEAVDPKEQFALLDLIEAVQGKVMHALAYEERLQHLSVEEGQAGGRTTNIARHDEAGNDKAYGPHHIIVWTPEHGEDVQFGIARLEVRMSDQSQADFFLRAFDVYENEQNFLLNSKGLVPFNTAGTDIEPAELLDTSTAHFTVREGIVCVPAVNVDVFALDAIFNLETYKLFEQPRKLDKGPHWGQAS